MCNGRAEGERDARRRKKAPTAQQRNAREPRGAYPARAEMDFGIGIVGRQEAASFPHTLKVNNYVENKFMHCNELAANRI
jgi:hypothetical protein